MSQLGSLGLAVTTPVSATNSPLLASRILHVTDTSSLTVPAELTVEKSETETAASSRKTSVTSQTTAPAGSPKRGEVYV